MPSQNSGMAYSTIEPPVVSLSKRLPRRQPALAPSHSPRATVMTVDSPTSHSVFGSSSLIVVQTGRPVSVE